MGRVEASDNIFARYNQIDTPQQEDNNDRVRDENEAGAGKSAAGGK